jgi:hypothetical protein
MVIMEPSTEIWVACTSLALCQKRETAIDHGPTAVQQGAEEGVAEGVGVEQRQRRVGHVCLGALPAAPVLAGGKDKIVVRECGPFGRAGGAAREEDRADVACCGSPGKLGRLAGDVQELGQGAGDPGGREGSLRLVLPDEHLLQLREAGQQLLQAGQQRLVADDGPRPGGRQLVTQELAAVGGVDGNVDRADERGSQPEDYVLGTVLHQERDPIPPADSCGGERIGSPVGLAGYVRIAVDNVLEYEGCAVSVSFGLTLDNLPDRLSLERKPGLKAHRPAPARRTRVGLHQGQRRRP